MAVYEWQMAVLVKPSVGNKFSLKSMTVYDIAIVWWWMKVQICYLNKYSKYDSL